jgi:hypothetical protein
MRSKRKQFLSQRETAIRQCRIYIVIGPLTETAVGQRAALSAVAERSVRRRQKRVLPRSFRPAGRGRRSAASLPFNTSAKGIISVCNAFLDGVRLTGIMDALWF